MSDYVKKVNTFSMILLEKLRPCSQYFGSHIRSAVIA